MVRAKCELNHCKVGLVRTVQILDFCQYKMQLLMLLLDRQNQRTLLACTLLLRRAYH